MANEFLKNILPNGIMAVAHGNSLWDFFKGFGGKKDPNAAENAAGRFGGGWGDEQQLAKERSILANPAGEIWDDLIATGYTNFSGLRKIQARDKLKDLRLFLTSWDKLEENGTETTKKDTTLKSGTVKKVEQVKKVFGPSTKNAHAFMLRMVEIITEEEKRLGEEAAKAAPDVALTDAQKREFRVQGCHKVLRHFDTIPLPRMPLPGDKDFIDTIEEWQEKILGSNPTEGVKKHIDTYVKKIEEKPKGFLYRIMSRFSPF